ncbi:MAG: mechanosensitive ion channel [Dehalococcoidia bacterium]|nr:mechanosensitive ion channel [Dehalococcoidia bacterium]
MMDPVVFAAIRDWGIWDQGHAARLLFALVVLLVAAVVFKVFLSRVFSQALTRAVRGRSEERQAVERRVNTLSNTLNWGFRTLLFFVAVGLTLSEFGLNVSALIASVGVVGVALGLGAQLLVRDVINGMFILIEDQYAVGDTVTVAGVTGEVIEINPRRTVVRDADGNVHSIPNSTITVATNRTAGLNRFSVTLQTPFRESDRAAALAERVCAELAADRAEAILSGPRMAEQKAGAEGLVDLIVAGDARPKMKWSVEAELRRRLKRAFEAERLEMDFVPKEPK